MSCDERSESRKGLGCGTRKMAEAWERALLGRRHMHDLFSAPTLLIITRHFTPHSTSPPLGRAHLRVGGCSWRTLRREREGLMIYLVSYSIMIRSWLRSPLPWALFVPFLSFRFHSHLHKHGRLYPCRHDRATNALYFYQPPTRCCPRSQAGTQAFL